MSDTHVVAAPADRAIVEIRLTGMLTEDQILEDQKRDPLGAFRTWIT